MAYLEYRIIDKNEEFPLLCYYQGIDKDEIALRFACDFFVQDGIVYVQEGTAVDGNKYVVYVKPDNEEKPLQHTSKNNDYWANIRVELRHFKGEREKNHPLIHFTDFRDDDDAILHLLGTLFYAQNKEWRKTSAEVDEDRKTYVVYVEPNV